MLTVARPVLFKSVTNQDGGYAPFTIKYPAVFLLKSCARDLCSDSSGNGVSKENICELEVIF